MTTNRTGRRALRPAAVVTLALPLLLGLAACGDADDTTAIGAGAPQRSQQPTDGEPAGSEFCDLSAQLDEQDGPPTPEQFDALERTADPAIAEDVSFAVAQFKEKGFAAFEDPEVAAAIERIEAWEAENCPGAAERQQADEESAPAQEPAPDAIQVNVIATDFDFTIQGDVPAGKVAFVMENQGAEPHHMEVAKFKEGTTKQQAEQAVDEGLEAVEKLLEDFNVGTSSTAPPGGTAVLNADLAPGLYGMACFVETDGQPHIFKGMLVIFEVSGSVPSRTG